MSESISINSHKGSYQVSFLSEDVFLDSNNKAASDNHFIVDAKVADLYRNELASVLKASSVLLIEATEENKSLDRFPAYIDHLVKNGVRRNHKLVAIGGGIIQDITCFLAATVLRGIGWIFYPTTLLAQADSCIGSKSSINCGGIKNILGTFTPPEIIYISQEFLNTLNMVDLRSGVGEMLKVHAINGVEEFNSIAKEYDNIFMNPSTMLHYIKKSLELKKSIIEQDEFDQGVRNVMNYGHTFGHAIESATGYKIPHGIAVSIGMDMANFVAYKLGFSSPDFFSNMHPVLKKNYSSFVDHDIPLNEFLFAIAKDKKNMGSNSIGLILPDKLGKVSRVYFENNELFGKVCYEYLSKGRLQ